MVLSRRKGMLFAPRHIAPTRVLLFAGRDDILKRMRMHFLSLRSIFFGLLLSGFERVIVAEDSAPVAGMSYQDQVRQMLPIAHWSFDSGKPDIGELTGKLKFGCRWSFGEGLQVVSGR